MEADGNFFDGQAALSYIAELEKKAFSVPWSYSAVLDSARLSCNRVYVAYEDDYGGVRCCGYKEYEGRGDNIGGYLICGVAGDESELLRLAVSPSLRRRGFGRRLMEHYFADTSCAGYFLEVREGNVAARGLYERMGYRPLGARKNYYSNPVCDAVVYGLDRTNDR